jgi:hypothetical protein
MIIRHAHEFPNLAQFTRVKLISEIRDGEVWYEVHIGYVGPDGNEVYTPVWVESRELGPKGDQRAGSPALRGLAQTQEMIAADWKDRILEAARANDN